MLNIIEYVLRLSVDKLAPGPLFIPIDILSFQFRHSFISFHPRWEVVIDPALATAEQFTQEQYSYQVEKPVSSTKELYTESQDFT